MLPEIFTTDKSNKIIIDTTILRQPILVDFINLKGEKKAIELLSFIWFYFDGNGMYKEVDIVNKFEVIASDLRLDVKALRTDIEFTKVFDFIEDKYTDSIDRLNNRLKASIQNLGIWAAAEIFNDANQKLAILKEAPMLMSRLEGLEEDRLKKKKNSKEGKTAYDQRSKIKKAND